MRFTVPSLAAFLALASSLLAAAAPQLDVSLSVSLPFGLEGWKVNHDGSVSPTDSSERYNPEIVAPTATKRSPPNSLPATNAERLSRGLPLKRPRILDARKHHARTPAASPVPAYIQVKNRDTGAILGYVSATQTTLNNYGSYVQTTDGALRVLIPMSPVSQYSLLTLNGPSAEAPYFGAATGAISDSNDLASGSDNYMFIAGTGETAPGATPQSGVATTYHGFVQTTPAVESAIWTYDPSSGSLTIVWVNSDGTQIIPTIYRDDTDPNYAYFGFTSDYDRVAADWAVSAGETLTPLTFWIVTA